MKRFLLFVLCTVLCTVVASAQPANDDCPGFTIDQADLDDMSGTCQAMQSGTTVDATPWEVSPGLNFQSGCWNGADTLNVVFYSFEAQGVSGSVEVLNGPDDYYISVISFNGAACDGTDIAVLGCGANAPIEWDNILTIDPPTTYYVVVAFANNTPGSFDLCVFNPPPAPNDECIDATDISGSIDGSCFSVPTNYYPSSENTTCFPPGATQSVWFSFTSVGVSIADLHIEGAPDVAHVAVWEFDPGEECDLGLGTLWSCAANVDVNNPIVLDGALTIGNQYFIEVAFDNNATGPFDVCLTAPPPAFNDDCLDAPQYPNSELSNENNCLTNIGGENLNNNWPSTDVGTAGCWNNDDFNVWFWFEAQGPDVEIEVMADLGDNEQIALIDFTGGNFCDGPSGAIIECAFAQVLEVDDQLEIGHIYYVMVGFEDNAVGDYCINIFNPVPPDNDTACAAVPLMTDGSCNSGPPCTNYCYTTEYANSDDSPGPNGVVASCIPYMENTVWFTMQLTDPSNVGFEIDLSEGTAQDLGAIIGTFNDCTGAFNQLAIFCGAGSDPLEFGPVDDAETYYILVGTSEVGEGTFDICVTEIPPCFDNNYCEDPLGVSSARDLGQLVTVSTGGGGGGCAGAGDPFACFDGCNYFADPIEYGGIACLGPNDPVVWFSFTTDGNAALANIVVSSAEFAAPAFQLFQAVDGSCGSLVPLGACTVGSGGEASISSVDVGALQTYFVAVGGQLTAGGNFEICISILENLTACTLNADITVTGRSQGGALEGPFFPGETVSLCMNVNAYTSGGNNCQWIQGIVPTFGNGWDPTSFDGSGMPVDATLNGNTFTGAGGSAPSPVGSSAVWQWLGDVTYHYDNCFFNVADFDGNGTLDICNSLFDEDCSGPGLTGGSGPPCWQNVPGNALPPGWFASGIQGDCTSAIGHPTVDYGDGTCCNCVEGPWNFCFDLIVRPFPDCNADQTTMDLSLGFVTFADGETGAWSGTSSVCANDQPVDIRLPGCCVDLEDLSDFYDPICSGGLFNWTIDYPGIDFWTWTVDAGSVTGATEGQGANPQLILDNLANPGSSSQTVTYNILGFDGGECPAAIWVVSVEVLPEITIDMSPFRACATPTSPYELIPTVDGGDGSYTYEWTDGSANSTLTIPSPQGGQVYGVTVTDGAGCTAATSVVLDVYETFPVDIDASAFQQCLVDGDIDLSVSANGGIPAYDFNWTSPTGGTDNGSSIQVNESGKWKVIATDDEGCMGADSVILNFYESPYIEVDPVAVCLNNPRPAQINAFVSNGVQPYEYFWMTPSAEFTTSFIVVDEIGDYSVTVTDFNGCSAVHDFEVLERESPYIVLPSPVVVCEADLATGQILEVQDDPSFIAYEWSTSGTNSSIQVNQVGTYTVTVTNDGACINTSQVTVSTFDTIPDQFLDTIRICPGGTADIDGDQQFSYVWNFSQTGSFYLATREETVFVTIEDLNGCTRDEEIAVVESENLVPNISADTVICGGVQVEITADDFPIIAWYANSELTDLIASNTDMIIASTPGWYFVEVSDGAGCFGVDSIQIIESDPDPVIDGVPAICDGESSTLNVPGVWDDINWSTGETTSSIVTDSAGIFYVTVTNSLNCSAVSMPFIVSESGLPVPDITGDASFCFGDSSTLDAGGPFATYNWSNGETGQTISTDSSGTLYVTVTNAAGCEGVDTFVVAELTPLTPQITGATTICNNVAVALDATGANFVSYSWSTGDSGASIQPDTAGTFVVTVTDANGCTGTDDIVVQAGDPAPTINGNIDACAGETEILVADAGYASYEWSTSESTASINVSATGTYVVTVTDLLGCTDSTSFDFLINENPIPNINGSLTFCTGGYTDLDAGNGYVDYAWSDGQSGQAVSITVEGPIIVTVTDANGCVGTDSVMIVESTELDLNVQDTAICEGDAVTLIVGNFASYEWFDASTDPTFIATAGGNYAVTVTDASGCSGTADIVVTEFLEPFADVNDVAEACNTSVGGVISEIDFSTLILGGDTGGSWNDLDDSKATGVFPILDFTGVIPGDYQFEYTTNSAQGPCDDQSYLVTVTVWDCVCPSPSINAPADLCSDNDMLDLVTLFNSDTEPGGVWTIVSTPSGGNPATLSGSVFDASNADPGIYEIQYTISGIPSNCVDNDVQQILVNDPPDAGLAGQPAQVCAAEDSTIVLTDLIIGGQSGGTWIETSATMSQAGFDELSGSFNTELEMPGTYTFEYILQGIDPCPSASTTIEVVIEDVPVADAGNDKEITCEAPNADLDGSGSSQGAVFEYNWRFNGAILASGSMNTSVNDAGVYELEVINTATGCRSYDEVEVKINGDIPVMITKLYLPVCGGDPPASVEVESLSGGTGPFTYSLNGEDESANGTYTNLDPGDYTLLVIDANGCTDRFEFTVNPTTAVDGIIVGETVVDRGDDFVLTYKLTEGIADSVVWVDEYGALLCVQCDTLRFEAVNIVDVFVTIYDKNGCNITLSASLFVKIVKEVYVPNVFTPNGDGVNDFVTLYAPEGTVIRKFEVFSRWGELVFASATDIPVNTPELGWNGKFGEDELQPGVFVFHAQVLYPGDEHEEVIKGDITLIR